MNLLALPLAVVVALMGPPPVAACRDAPPRGMACIPGGPFLRGTDDGPADTRPRQSVFVQTFYMDLDEVTYSAWQACVRRGACRRAGPNYSDFDHPRQPITGVNWFDAVQFCEAAGKHLPTEAEWEKAARGADGERFPWGDAPADCTRAVIEDDRGKSCGINKRGEEPEKGRPEPIRSRAPGRYGLYDMAGNSWEWVADWHTPSWTDCGATCAGPDPRGPCEGAVPCAGFTEKVVRGGSWFWSAAYAEGAHRRPHTPENAPVFHHFGFRCAASILEAAALFARPPDRPVGRQTGGAGK